MKRFHKILILPQLIALVVAPATARSEQEAPEVRIYRGAMTLLESSIVKQEVSYEVGGVKLKGFMAYDETLAGKRPGVLVVHEWWGHNDYVRTRARMLAEMGYTAFALDMYGEGKLAQHPADAQKFMMEVLGNIAAAEARFEAARKILREHASSDDTKIAAIGYCFGGAVVLHMARAGVDLDGVASFHGNLSTQTPAVQGAVKARVLVLHGADDPLIPPEQVEAFKKEMEQAKVDMKLIAYPGAVHSFTNPGATVVGEALKMPLAYNESADQKSWAELDRFLEEIFTD